MKSLIGILRQWLADRGATIEFKGRVEGSLVQNELRRIETKLTGRMDALEDYVEDVMEKYLRKITARENRAKQKEESAPVETETGFEMIRRKFGGRE
jgi:hypothetical protein